MDKWKDKVALITGANSGCGLKILENFAKHGLKVVGLDVKDDEMIKLKNSHIHCLLCDITNDVSVKCAFLWIEENLGGVDVLINCAGIANSFGILDYEKSMDDLQKCMDVNFSGTIRYARYAFKSMEKRNVFGCIINVNSVAGHRIIDMGDCKLGLYSVSKHALVAATETLRFELNNLKNKKVRVTSISPGLIDTSLFKSSQLPETFLNRIDTKIEKLTTQDIVDVCIYVLSMPYRINVSELIIRATGSSF